MTPVRCWNVMRGTTILATLWASLVLVPACRAPAPVAGKEVKMQEQATTAADLATEIARRLGELAAARQRLVVYVEQFGTSPAARDAHAAIEKLLKRDGRIVLSRLADGVSVPESPPPGGGYSEAIGMRIPTPSPDVTVQLSDADGGVAVYAVLHTGPSRSERLFQLDVTP